LEAEEEGLLEAEAWFWDALVPASSWRRGISFILEEEDEGKGCGRRGGLAEGTKVGRGVEGTMRGREGAGTGSGMCS
jgi:hypothetical protein